jgi:hypothetical protein
VGHTTEPRTVKVTVQRASSATVPSTWGNHRYFSEHDTHTPRRPTQVARPTLKSSALLSTKKIRLADSATPLGCRAESAPIWLAGPFEHR